MADAPARTDAPAKSTMSERRAMGLRQLAASLDDFSEHSLPLSGYVCGSCATPLPVGVLDCPTCHTPVAVTTPLPHHPAGVPTGSDQPIIVEDAAASIERTRHIRRNWLRRPEAH